MGPGLPHVPWGVVRIHDLVLKPLLTSDSSAAGCATVKTTKLPHMTAMADFTCISENSLCLL